MKQLKRAQADRECEHVNERDHGIGRRSDRDMGSERKEKRGFKRDGDDDNFDDDGRIAHGGRKLIAQKRRASPNDIERFKLMLTKIKRNDGTKINSLYFHGKQEDFNDQASHDVIIEVLDTGVWAECKSFDDTRKPEIPSRWRGQCELGADFSPSLCNKKLIGVQSFSHGFHMASGEGNDKDVVSSND